jgi:hypothetical protein
MQKLFDHIRSEWAVLRGAPFTFLTLVIFGVAAGLVIGQWHYSERFNAQDDQIRRYRVALGIDKYRATK